MLRSVKDLHYYGLHATDGNMGVVYSVLFEELTWTVRYLVVDTGTWLPGRQVLIAPISLGVVDWETQRILRWCVPESARWRELSLAEAKRRLS